MMWRGILTSVALVLSFAQPAAAQQAAAFEAVATEHSGTFNGHRVRYSANVAATVVQDQAGAPAVSMVSIAYVADGAAPDRPVMFMFNGGPGAASSLLQMGAFGPRRYAAPGDLSAPIAPPFRVRDNHDTILDVADIVFIDPPGAGFSRVLAGANEAELQTTAGDARVFACFVTQWLAEHGRSNAPVFLLGESYGTIRIPAVLDELSKFDAPATVAGVFLMGQAVNIVETVQRPDNIVGQAVNLPTLAAIAWYHNRVSHSGRTFESFLDEVRAFALEDYLLALAKGRTLDDQSRASIATRLASFTGVPASYWSAHGLSLSKMQFRQELMRDEGHVLGFYDGRYIGTEGDPAAPVVQAYSAALQTHLRDWLRVPNAGEYRANIPVEQAENWTYGGPSSPFNHYNFTAMLATAMARNPNMRVMLGSGYYDLSTTFGAAEYLRDRSSLPRERVEIVYYQAGHAAYTDDASFRQLMRDVRRFVTESVGARP